MLANHVGKQFAKVQIHDMFDRPNAYLIIIIATHLTAVFASNSFHFPKIFCELLRFVSTTMNIHL